MITNYFALACIAMILAMTGAITAHASEVTGTLSSDATHNSKSSGDIRGTVTIGSQAEGDLGSSVTDDSVTDGNLVGTVSGGGGGSSVSRSGGSGGSSLPDTPSGSVLGEFVTNTQTPNFPNAGFAPEEDATPVTVWLTLVTFLKNTVSF